MFSSQALGLGRDQKGRARVETMSVSIESTGGFELGIELVVKARALGRKIVEVPTTWRDRVAGKSNFKLWKWLPNYLRWFFYAFAH